MNSKKHIWNESWEADVTNRIKEKGYLDILDLLDDRPGETYNEIASFIGENVAPIQIIGIQYNQAKKKDKIREALKDSLCRNIIEELPGGYGIGVDPTGKFEDALADWCSEAMVTGGLPELEETLDRIIEGLLQQKIPKGWLPKTANDKIINDIFNEQWPQNVGDGN